MTNQLQVELNWPGRRRQIPLVSHRVKPRCELHFPGSGDAPESGGTAPANLLLQGDNRLGLRHLLSGWRDQVRLIYLDPPFATGNRFRQPAGRRRERSAATAYSDAWNHGDGAYLNMLEELLRLSRELLAADGSLYLHLDYRTAPVAKLLLDEIFGPACFINEIIWAYRTGGMPEKLGFGRKHDTILFYARDPARTRWHRQKEKSYVSHRYGFSNIELHEDEQGPYTLTNLRDVWDIPALRGNQPERVPYPTQKPLELLRRIILASSDPGDVVLDPGSGSGTALVAAEQLGRRWIGLDNSPLAVSVIRNRLQALPERREWTWQQLSSPAGVKVKADQSGDGEKPEAVRQRVLSRYGATPSNDHLYHGERDGAAVQVLLPRERMLHLRIEQLSGICNRQQRRRLELLLPDGAGLPLARWRRDCRRQDSRLVVKQIPPELLNGEPLRRHRIAFDEIPELVVRKGTGSGNRWLELADMVFHDPSDRQRLTIDQEGWRGLVDSWWVRDSAGNVVWHSGCITTVAPEVPLRSGPLPAGVRLRVEVCGRQGAIW